MAEKIAKARYVPQAWETVPCPFCSSEKFTVYERFGSELQYTYVLCAQCSLVYQSPRPKYDQHFINAAYAEYYQFADSLELNDQSDIRESSVTMFKKEVNHLVRYDKKGRQYWISEVEWGHFYMRQNHFIKESLAWMFPVKWRRL